MIKDLEANIDYLFPKGYPIVFLHAHPDDESFLGAGLIQELLQLERECILIYGAASLVQHQPKTIIRQEEARIAADILGNPSVIYLNYCEPHYSGVNDLPLIYQDIGEMAQELRKILDVNGIIKPFILISYDKNGGYGNQDHRVIHAIGREFLGQNSSILPIMLEITINRDRVKEWFNNSKVKLNPKLLPDLSYWSDDFGLPSNKITYCYTLSDAQLLNKRKALAAHNSQMDQKEFPLCLGKDDFKDFFGKEWLYLVKHDPQQFYEIEKKYLVDKIVFDISQFDSSEIVQGYISIGKDGSEERIRSRNGIFTRTITESMGLLKRGKEVEISEGEFNQLWKLTKGRRVNKTRFIIPYNNLRIELDIYHGSINGLITAEVEFPSEKSANDFRPPSWFGLDVTEDTKYKNQNLAH